jgi:hypothetical protein
MNTNSTSPGLFLKDSAGNLVKVGPVHVGTTAPNASPASGGQSGNTVGEQWLDTSGSTYVFKIWDGSAWRSEAGEFVNITGDVMTGALGIIAGSAASPGLYFSGDTNTGLYSPGADQVALATGGTGRLFISDNGVATGGAPQNGYGGIQVRNSFVYINEDGANTVQMYLRTASSEPAIQIATNHPFKIQTNNQERLRVTADGKVGLGTSSVGYKLHVQDATTTDVMIQAGASGSDTNRRATLNLLTSGSKLFKIQADASDGSLKIIDDSTARVTISNTGAVGIGTTTAGAVVHAEIATSTGNVAKFSGSWFNRALMIVPSNDGISLVTAENNNESDTQRALIFRRGSTESARLDGQGRLLVGTSSASNGPIYALDTGNGRDISGELSAANAFGFRFVTYKARGSTGSKSIVADGDELGVVVFHGYGGSSFHAGAQIQAFVDGTPGTNDMPGRLVFSTTADGAASPTEAMRISADGSVRIRTSDAAPAVNNVVGVAINDSSQQQITVDAGSTLVLNRKSNDGVLLAFRQDATEEGNISVSGTTISYNGAHLSRWSQLPGGAEREEILRGTVLSNIDEMCAWDEEANEQLNRMKVSDVEGDPNVAGVFQAWDDDDDTYTDDFYCAMTGDFIIRIAEGVTVQRGDLLMSAGDGTAKPQDDDIIRSKTIAKVTSTHITCTYDDGSYCVPCVLMAC